MKLVYWYAKCKGDSDAYSIREKTKKEAIRAKFERGGDFYYGPVCKVQVDYADGFELMKEASGEGGIFDEARAHYQAGGD